MHRIDMTGNKFGKLTVIGYSHTDKNSRAFWKCQCDCGNKKIVPGSTLRNKTTKSCGCKRKYHGTVDSKNKKYNYLLMLEFSHYENGYAFWKCLCDCGKIGFYNGRYIRNGQKKSCGCRRGEGNITHNKSYTNIYWIWDQMKRRCNETKNKKYKSYGERGIKVCDEWLSFDQFYKDMGERPEGMSLDRIDNDGNYCKENCHWATAKQQANNTRRNKK